MKAPDLVNFRRWLESLTEDQLRNYMLDWYWKHEAGEGHINVLHHFIVERNTGVRLVMDGKLPISDWPSPTPSPSVR